MESLDRRILALLARDGRMSYTDIGKETGLSTRPPSNGCGGWSSAG
jgi:DNA-binding Lrp family transcriptional regulator